MGKMAIQGIIWCYKDVYKLIRPCWANLILWKNSVYFVKIPVLQYLGTANFNRNFYVMGAKNRQSENWLRMMLWTWIFQNRVTFWFISLQRGKPSHIYGLNTHMLKKFSFLLKLKFSNCMPIQVFLGITYPKIIILGQKMGSTPQKSIFSKNIWKSSKKLKIPITQPIIVLDQNPLGAKVYLGQGSKPCTNCTGTSQVKFLHLVTSEKNGRLIHQYTRKLSHLPKKIV